MKNIAVTYDSYGKISSISDLNMTFEQENVLTVTPTFPSSYYTLTETGDTTDESTSVLGTFDTNVIKTGMAISGSSIPTGTTISNVTANTITLSQNATATASGVTLTITSTEILSLYEARAYLRASNSSGDFYTMTDGTFEIPSDVMIEGDLRIGFEIKDGTDYIRFEPFKVKIKDFVRISSAAGRFDYTVTIDVGETTTLEAGESATVTNAGTNKDGVFNFGIPRGANAQIRVDSGYIQGKNETDAEWTNLVAVNDLKADDIEFGTSETHIQVRYFDNSTQEWGAWEDLVPLNDLKADDVHFQKTDDYIQYRYYDHSTGTYTEWQNLIAVEDLVVSGVWLGDEEPPSVYDVWIYEDGETSTIQEHMDDTDIHVTAEDKTAWNGAVEDLGEFYGGEVVADVIETTTKEGVYMLTKDTTEKVPLLVTTLYSDETLTTKLKAKQIIPLISDRLLEQYWNGSIWTHEYYAYLSDLTPILADIVALYGKFSTGTKTATSTGTAGQMSYDDNYFYACTATNTWIRFAKTAW